MIYFSKYLLNNPVKLSQAQKIKQHISTESKAMNKFITKYSIYFNMYETIL